MIAITFRGKSLDEVLTQIQAAAQASTGVSPTQLTGGATTATAALAETKPARTRKTKDSTPTEAPATQAAPAPTAPAETAPQATATEQPAAQALSNITKAQVSGELQKLAEKGGMPLVKDTLKKFGASRVGDVPPAKYSEFMAECARALN